MYVQKNIIKSVLLPSFKYEYNDELVVQPELLESDINHF